MSKSKKPPVESDVVPVVPVAAPAPAPVAKPAVVRPVGWRLRPVGSGGEFVEVIADSVEDAIRAFNGLANSGRSPLTAKKLEILPPGESGGN
jgi:hypothetical protein